MVLCVKIVWTSRSHLGGPITGSGASYWSGIVSAMARVGLGRVLDWPVLTAWCPDARRWIGTCVAPSLRLCQSHGCRDVAACAPELLQIASFLTDVGELIKRRRRADQPGGRRDDEH